MRSRIVSETPTDSSEEAKNKRVLSFFIGQRRGKGNVLYGDLNVSGILS